MLSCQYNNSHYKDKTVSRAINLHHGNSYTYENCIPIRDPGLFFHRVPQWCDTHTHIYIYIYTYIESERQTDRQTNRQTDRDRERGGERERETDRQTHTHTNRHRHRQTGNERVHFWLGNCDGRWLIAAFQIIATIQHLASIF